MQSWWKALDLWLWKWNPFGCKGCVKFTLNTARQHKISAPLKVSTLLPSEEVWVLYKPPPAQLHGHGWGVSGRASPTCCAINTSRHLLGQAESWCDNSLGFTSPCGLLAGMLNITSWKGSCQGRDHLVFWAHQLLDRSPQAALRWLFRYILPLRNAILPVALHHAQYVSEWLTVQASR